MKRRRVVPKLYDALYSLSALRDQALAFRSEIPDRDAARFASRVDDLENKALQLLDQVERHQRVARH